MKVEIKRIDKDLPLPKYETDGSVGFDLLAREEVIIPSRGISLIPGNVIVKVPDGYMLTIASRSSTPRKKGLLTPHGIGVIDQDYHGPEDEILIQVYNFQEEDVVIARGDRIAQGILIRVDRMELIEIEEHFKTDSRGGVGSTG